MTNNSTMPESSNADHGFQFPAAIEVTAIGVAEGDFTSHVLALLERSGARVRMEQVRTRDSSGGKYQSVCVVIDCDTRADYDHAHASLRASPAVKWTL